MKKLFLRSMALLLVAVMVISVFVSCEETDNDEKTDKGNVTDSDKDVTDSGEDATDSDKEVTDSGEDVTDSDKEVTDSSEDVIDVGEGLGTEGLEFVLLEDGTYGVKAGNTQLVKEIVIPSKYNGKEVTQILPDAFNEATNLESIIVPSSVKSIGSYAFRFCSALESVKIGKGLEIIDEYAFYCCNALERINIPNSVKIISEGALFCCGLTNISIPESVENIGKEAFEACSYLENIIVDENNNMYKSIDGCLYSKDLKTFIQYPRGKKDTTFTIPDGVEIIGASMFASSNLVSVSIPNSVTSIGSHAFYGCIELTSIKFRGSEAEWNAIEKGDNWNKNVPASCQIIF